ncbi:MAG: ABC transporter ATP-binding protein [Ruminococcaceae bacterium]|nr:ABC transporter ATP-binding protein [Oscillospiraceae bacterium]
MIEIINVTKKFGDFTAIQDMSFKVENGSIYGLVGYNGAGKTTLLKTIADVYRADGGTITIDGKKIADSAKEKEKIFYVPDDIYFVANSTMDKMAKFYAGFYPKFNYETYNKLVEVFGLNPKKRLNGFSKGMQRQAEMVLAMSTRPEVLLLDESFDGLDPAKRALMRELIIEYANETGASVIISSHNLHELENMCDHVGLINGKKLVINTSVDDMSASVCKFRIIFNDKKDKEDFKGFDIKDFKRDGKIITMVIAGDYEETEQKLSDMAPLLLEKYPLTLEEIFLNEMEDKSYDITKIF